MIQYIIKETVTDLMDQICMVERDEDTMGLRHHPDIVKEFVESCLEASKTLEDIPGGIIFSCLNGYRISDPNDDLLHCKPTTVIYYDMGGRFMVSCRLPMSCSPEDPITSSPYGIVRVSWLGDDVGTKKGQYHSKIIWEKRYIPLPSLDEIMEKVMEIDKTYGGLTLKKHPDTIKRFLMAIGRARMMKKQDPILKKWAIYADLKGGYSGSVVSTHIQFRQDSSYEDNGFLVQSFQPKILKTVYEQKLDPTGIVELVDENKIFDLGQKVSIKVWELNM